VQFYQSHFGSGSIPPSGNYMKFYEAIKAKYPDIQLISNCDGSKSALDHPADLYDYHVCPQLFKEKICRSRIQ
jgi:hypothetical protein